MDRKSLLKDFSYKLRKYRESFSYTHRKMADLFGTIRANYSRYESGTIFPNFFRLYYFAITTGISLDWLVSGKEPMYYKEKTEEKKETVDAAKEVKEEKQEIEKKEEPQPEAALSKPAGKISDAETESLLDHMERIPLLRHEVLVTFYKFKEEHKEMVEAAAVESPQFTN